MKNLLEFLQRHFHWILFVVLEVLSIMLVLRHNSYQSSVWFSSANALTGRIYEWSSAVETFFSLTKVNEELVRRNFYQERQLSQLRRLYGEATDKATPSEQEALDRLEQYDIIPAKVVTSELHLNNNLLTIDKGSDDGVEAGMGVACGQGVVGVVHMTSSHYSIVIPVLNVKSSRISCAIRNRGYFGVLRWDGKDAGVAYVEDIPRHARFKRGEWVETNGYSSIFPPGVLVGQIREVYNSRDGLSYRLKVRLSTDFGRLRDVLVISDKTISERVRLMQAARDSLKLNVQQ
ncbi:MAG: rod shape-determining protein MreC [Prevotella sp.]|jgi:rod shape-determining protein MreC|nr:rod shape-determining protein MreC [Prevotella sp.]